MKSRTIVSFGSVSNNRLIIWSVRNFYFKEIELFLVLLQKKQLQQILKLLDFEQFIPRFKPSDANLENLRKWNCTTIQLKWFSARIY